MEDSRKQASMLKDYRKLPHSARKLLLHGKPVTGNISFQPIYNFN